MWAWVSVNIEPAIEQEYCIRFKNLIIHYGTKKSVLLVLPKNRRYFIETGVICNINFTMFLKLFLFFFLSLRILKLF